MCEYCRYTFTLVCGSKANSMRPSPDTIRAVAIEVVRLASHLLGTRAVAPSQTSCPANVCQLSCPAVPDCICPVITQCTLENLETHWIVCLAFVLVGLAGFTLGRASAIPKKIRKGVWGINALAHPAQPSPRK